MVKYKVLTNFGTTNDGKNYTEGEEIEMKVADADTINEQAKELHKREFLKRIEDKAEDKEEDKAEDKKTESSKK